MKDQDKWQWFKDGKYGLFIHWGPFAKIGHGEQSLFREHMSHEVYAKEAVSWNPHSFDAEKWAQVAKDGGFKYACLTTRHHDGYCLWDSAYTDYTSAKQAPMRDFVREYVDAFREAGLKVGLYYSWLDWRLPAYFEGPEVNPEGWAKVKEYLWHQVEELLTNYGKIDYMFFDGVWPRSAKDLGSVQIIDRIRTLQPDIILNDRFGLGNEEDHNADGGAGAGKSDLGDFGTPENQIRPEDNRLWESCQVSNWRLWGHHSGERCRPSDMLLNSLCECVSKGGNMILNVAPGPEGDFPQAFVNRSKDIGQWLMMNGEAIYGAKGADIIEFITGGWQTQKDNVLYLIYRFWPQGETLRIYDLVTPVTKISLVASGEILKFTQKDEEILIVKPQEPYDVDLFPVIKIEFTEEPKANQWGRERLWAGDPQRVAKWARSRGDSVYYKQEE